MFQRNFCDIFQTVGPICEQFAKGVWEIAALAEGYVLTLKWGAMCHQKTLFLSKVLEWDVWIRR